MRDPETAAQNVHLWAAFWTAASTVGVVLIVQLFRYLTKMKTTETVEGRVVLDNSWKTLFDAQNQAHSAAVASLEKRVALLAAEHNECMNGQRAMREKHDALTAQIELLRVAISKPESILIVTDYRGVVLSASEGAVPFFKRPLTDIVGSDCRQLMDDHSWSRHVLAFEKGANRPPPRLTAGKAKDSTGAVFDVAVDTRRSFVGSDGRWIYVAEISKVRV